MVRIAVIEGIGDFAAFKGYDDKWLLFSIQRQNEVTISKRTLRGLNLMILTDKLIIKIEKDDWKMTNENY